MRGKRKYVIAVYLLMTYITLSGCVEKHVSGEPDVISSMKMDRDEILTVAANCEQIKDKEEFAKQLIEMCKNNSFQSIKFSVDKGYATSLRISVYLWEDEIEEQEPVMEIKYKPIEWSEEYDIVNDPEKFQLIVDGELIEE